jgi:hypothetical protein
MARTFTVQQIMDRCRRRADMEHSNFISDQELVDLISEAFAELYDVLVAAFQNYFVGEASISLTNGTSTYALPAGFYKSISVDIQNAGKWDSLFPFEEIERNSVLTTSSSIPNATVRLRFIPAPPIYTYAGRATETVDGRAGWETLLVTTVAIFMLQKEESDTSALERRKQAELARIQSMAQNRDVTNPGTITDVTVYDNAYIKDALRYRFYGDQIEFINLQYIGV